MPKSVPTADECFRGIQDIICIWWRHSFHASVWAGLCFYSWSLADNYSKIIALSAAVEEPGQMAANADGCSQAKENIFKECCESINCFSALDNPISHFFFIIQWFTSLLLCEVICLLCPAIQKAGHRSDMPGSCSAKPSHKSIPMDHSSELTLPNGALFIVGCMGAILVLPSRSSSSVGV